MCEIPSGGGPRDSHRRHKWTTTATFVTRIDRDDCERAQTIPVRKYFEQALPGRIDSPCMHSQFVQSRLILTTKYCSRCPLYRLCESLGPPPLGISHKNVPQASGNNPGVIRRARERFVYHPEKLSTISYISPESGRT